MAGQLFACRCELQAGRASGREERVGILLCAHHQHNTQCHMCGGKAVYPLLPVRAAAADAAAAGGDEGLGVLDTGVLNEAGTNVGAVHFDTGVEMLDIAEALGYPRRFAEGVILVPPSGQDAKRQAIEGFGRRTHPVMRSLMQRIWAWISKRKGRATLCAHLLQHAIVDGYLPKLWSFARDELEGGRFHGVSDMNALRELTVPVEPTNDKCESRFGGAKRRKERAPNEATSLVAARLRFQHNPGLVDFMNGISDKLRADVRRMGRDAQQERGVDAEKQKGAKARAAEADERKETHEASQRREKDAQTARARRLALPLVTTANHVNEVYRETGRFSPEAKTTQRLKEQILKHKDVAIALDQELYKTMKARYNVTFATGVKGGRLGLRDRLLWIIENGVHALRGGQAYANGQQEAPSAAGGGADEGSDRR